MTFPTDTYMIISKKRLKSIVYHADLVLYSVGSKMKRFGFYFYFPFSLLEAMNIQGSNHLSFVFFCFP